MLHCCISYMQDHSCYLIKVKAYTAMDYRLYNLYDQQTGVPRNGIQIKFLPQNVTFKKVEK